MERKSMIFKGALREDGFTLIEILMVLVLIAILAAIGITQFTNFSADARTNTLKSNLQILRRGVATQNGQMRLRCRVESASWPRYTSVVSNDITGGAGALCTTTQVSTTTDRVFVSIGIPVNPWGFSGTSSTVTDCTTNGGASCTNKVLECGTAATGRTGASDGWCYNEGNGEIWANSARNDGNNNTTGNEYTL